MTATAAPAVELDKLVGMNEVAKYLPTPKHINTVWHWVYHGVRGYKLPTRLVGGRRYTTPREIQEYLAQLTRAANGG